MDPLAILLEQVGRFDAWFVESLSLHKFTYDLIHNPVSKTITELLFVTFVLLMCYETIYWSGIYLNLWDYHAKEIFKEIPIHCAHVYVRINFARRDDVESVRKYYELKLDSSYNILNWNKLNAVGGNVFELDQFVKYHFEFSPEDFENNPEPEFGSTIHHLRNKIFSTFKQSSIRDKLQFEESGLKPLDVLIFNNRAKEVGSDNDTTYLSKIHIETGNVIDSIILL